MTPPGFRNDNQKPHQQLIQTFKKFFQSIFLVAQVGLDLLLESRVHSCGNHIFVK
jgi:hypothetical protein